MKTNPQLIDIEDETRHDDRPVEVPEFSIESSSSQEFISNEKRPPLYVRKKCLRRRWLVASIVALFVLVMGILLWVNRYDFIKPEIDASVSDAQNIELLSKPYRPSASGTTVTSDSVLGVAFDMYSLNGLKASLEREIPDTADNTLVLFMRSAEYYPDNSMIGTVVIDGDKIHAKERKSRLAYVSISEDGRMTMGISLSDKMQDFVVSTDGSFFRQFVLLGDGEMPAKFQLHGKVERAALARMSDGEMYYVITRHKETMYDFADALREYGFMDAVYITGGNAYNFYRTSDGNAHVSQSVREKIEKYHDRTIPAPMLVFRTK